MRLAENARSCWCESAPIAANTATPTKSSPSAYGSAKSRPGAAAITPGRPGGAAAWSP